MWGSGGGGGRGEGGGGVGGGGGVWGGGLQQSCQAAQLPESSNTVVPDWRSNSRCLSYQNNADSDDFKSVTVFSFVYVKESHIKRHIWRCHMCVLGSMEQDGDWTQTALLYEVSTRQELGTVKAHQQYSQCYQTLACTSMQIYSKWVVKISHW